MPHRIHKCTNTLYDYAIIINTYVSLMYELKKMERYLRANLLGPGPRLMKKEFTGPRSHKGWETLPYGMIGFFAVRSAVTLIWNWYGMKKNPWCRIVWNRIGGYVASLWTHRCTISANSGLTFSLLSLMEKMALCDYGWQNWNMP